MAEGWRWIVAVIAIVALVGLILFARGTPDHGGPDTSPAEVARELTV